MINKKTKNIILSIVVPTLTVGVILSIALPLTLGREQRDFKKGVALTDLKVGDDISNYFIKWDFSNEYKWDRQTYTVNATSTIIEPESGYFKFSYDMNVTLQGIEYTENGGGGAYVADWTYVGSSWEFHHEFSPEETGVTKIENDDYKIKTINWDDVKNETGKSFYEWCKHQKVYSFDPT